MDEFVQSHATFDEEEAGDVTAVALEQSNSETAVDAIFEAAARETQCACGKSSAALEANMRLGGHLREVKKILPHGDFGREVEARLGFKRQWAARLMQLHEEWLDVLKAIEWAKSDNHLTRSELGVDRALALAAKWRLRVEHEGIAEAASKIFCDDGFVSKERIKKPDFIFYLKLFAVVLLWELERKRKLIGLLEAELRDVADAPCADQFLLPLPAGGMK